MARTLPEMGYFESNGMVFHGIVGLTPGRPISAEEAKAISAAKRAGEPKAAAVESHPVPQAAAASQSDVEDLKTQVAKLTAFITELPSVKG